jgi:hypothetical protein
MELAHSSYHYQSHKADKSQLMADVEAVAGAHVRYGTRRVRSQLRGEPHGYWVNRKCIQRIIRQKGLLQPVKRRKNRTTNSNHPHRCYSNLVKDLSIHNPLRPGLGQRYHLHPPGQWVCVSGGGAGCVHPLYSGLVVEQAD